MNRVHIGQPPSVVDPVLKEWLGRLVVQVNGALESQDSEMKKLKQEIKNAK